MKRILMIAMMCTMHMAFCEQRIDQLLPMIFHHLDVEPEVPSDFVAMSRSGNLSLGDWIYWGPKDVLEAYYQDTSSLKQGLIRVKFSPYVVQTGPSNFTKGFEEIKKYDPDAVFQETKWGDYPVLTVSCLIQEKRAICAWVGLNDYEAGWTLIFNLVYPDDQNEPNDNQRELWENFITKTQPFVFND